MTYYEQHKEERKAYQREYGKMRRKLEHAKLKNVREIFRHKRMLEIYQEFKG